MTRISIIAALAATLLVVLVLPGAASAAVIEHTGDVGSAAEDFLLYKGSGRERNRLTVVTGRRTITFVDKGARIFRKRGDLGACKVRSRHRAVCRIAADTQIDLLLGNGDDRVRFRGRAAGTKLGRAPRTNAATPEDLQDVYQEDDGGVDYRAFINGGRGDDVLNGTKASDVIRPGSGRNLVDGGSGRDRIVVAPTGRPDRVRGGRGLDTVEMVSSRIPVAIDLAAGTVKQSGRTDRLQSVERAHGTEGRDTLRGTEGPDGLFGDGENDVIEGLGGRDYLGGDLQADDVSGDPGTDTLVGGAGDDVLDGRDWSNAAGTPTDQLRCGDGNDTIVARGDDLVDACERSAFGMFTGELDTEQDVNLEWLATVNPVARGADGAPTYAISCPSDSGRQEEARCNGRVELRRPPGRQGARPAELLGYGEFSLKAIEERNVPVVLNAAGKAVFAQPSATVSVHVVMGSSAAPRPPGSTQQPTPGPDADFGWQQVLPRP